MRFVYVNRGKSTNNNNNNNSETIEQRRTFRRVRLICCRFDVSCLLKKKKLSTINVSISYIEMYSMHIFCFFHSSLFSFTLCHQSVWIIAVARCIRSVWLSTKTVCDSMLCIVLKRGYIYGIQANASFSLWLKLVGCASLSCFSIQQ